MSQISTVPLDEAVVVEDARSLRGVWTSLFGTLDSADQQWVVDCLRRYRDVLSGARL